MKKNKKILIVVGGGRKHLKPFEEMAKNLGIDVTLATFAKLEFYTDGGEVKVLLHNKDVANYDLCYLRLVGRRFEDVALLVYYLRKNGIPIIDPMYEMDDLIRLPMAKSIEAKMLIEAGIPYPRTYFGRTKMMAKICPDIFGFPFVIKGTTGKQGNAVWSPRNEKELGELVEKFTPLERNDGVRFIAQEFIRSSQRSRIFVIGDKAVAGITRPTRWRKRFVEKVDGVFPEGVRANLSPIPKKEAKMAVEAAKAVGIVIGGADVLTEDKTGKKYVIEVNSAPRWASIKKDTGIDVEREILKYLVSV